MRFKHLSILFFSSLALPFTSLVSAQETPASVPSGVEGTYELTFTEIGNSSIFQNGQSVTAVLSSNGELCINGYVLTNPVFRNGNQVEAIWVDSANNEEFAVSNFSTATFNEVNVTENGSFTGQLTGSRTSSSTDCVSIQLSQQAQSVFALVEEILPGIFGQSSDLKELGGYVYKFYATTGTYVGIKDGVVYTLGGVFGNEIKNRGPVTAVVNYLNDYKLQLDLGDVGVSGDYDLTLSISVVTFGISTTVVDGIVINNVPAPDPQDLDEIEQAINDQLTALDDVEGISNIEIVEFTVINNTADRITFTAAVSATVQQNGININFEYEVEYDYTQ